MRRARLTAAGAEGAVEAVAGVATGRKVRCGVGFEDFDLFDVLLGGLCDCLRDCDFFALRESQWDLYFLNEDICRFTRFIH